MSKFNRQIDYYATSCLWLSLEDFSNAGLTQDEMQAAIEKFHDRTRQLGPVRRAFINSNLVVEVRTNDPVSHEYLVDQIHEVLEDLLEMKTGVKRIRLIGKLKTP